MQLKWKENWSRSYKITVGVRKRIIDDYNNNGSVGVLRDPSFATTDDETQPSEALVMGNITSEGYDIRGFTFSFEGTIEAEQGGSKTENSVLTLYNLNQEFIDIINKPEAIIMIEAGYDDQTELAYTGDIDHVDANRTSKGDMRYDIKCTSGGQSFRNSLVSLQYDETLSDRDIILDMAKRFPGTALGSYGLEQTANRYVSGGTNFYGRLVTEFDKLMTRNNLNWCIFNGKMVIIPYRLIDDDLNKFNRTKFEIPADNIKRITENTNRSGEKSGDTKESIMKLTVNTFYIPAEIGQFIEIPDAEGMERFAGTYIIKGRRLLLNSRSGPWDTVFKVEQVV